MTEWTVAEGVSHDEAPGQLFCTVDGGYVEHSDHPDFMAAAAAGYPIGHDTRYLPDINTAMHFLVGNKLRFGDTIVMAGEPPEGQQPRNLKVDKVMRGTRMCFDVGGVGLPDGITELFNPEDLILWLANVLLPGDRVAYLEQ
jgi:hypothetical protein